MVLHKSSEDYLEAILMLREQKGSVRSIDVVRLLEVSKPSVSRAMALLRENGYITVDGDGLITLTESGQAQADRVYERHSLLQRWLVGIGVSPEVADADACLIEHDISEETFRCLKAHIAAERN